MLVKVEGYGLVSSTALEVNALMDADAQVYATPKQWRRINKRYRKYCMSTTPTPVPASREVIMWEAKLLCHGAQIAALEWGIEF